MWNDADIGIIEAGLRARGVHERWLPADRMGDDDNEVGESLLVFGGAAFTLSVEPGEFTAAGVDVFEVWGREHHDAGTGETFGTLEAALDRLAELMKGC